MLVSSVGGAFGTAFFVRLLQIGGRGGGKLVRLSLIARNVTTALAMAITTVLGGDISIAASVVVLSGILGATYGRSILDAMGVKDPIARGLGIGGSAQGLGVASLVSEPDAFPFAAISMVLTAVCFTTLVSIPAVKDELIRIATGA
jgi:putative effector of murein hydrolase